MVIYQVLRGDIESALEAYSSSIAQRDPFAVFFAAAHFLKPLRAHPRWRILAGMMNLSSPEYN